MEIGCLFFVVLHLPIAQWMESNWNLEWLKIIFISIKAFVNLEIDCRFFCCSPFENVVSGVIGGTENIDDNGFACRFGFE